MTLISDVTPELDLRPPGERYYRHPGDVVRVVLWGLLTTLLALFIQVATGTSEGVTSDLGRAATAVPQAARELLFALLQVAAVAAPVAILVALLVLRRFRRFAVIVLGAAAGAGLFALLDAVLDLPGRIPGALTSGTWLASTNFPSLTYLAGAAGAATVGKPWLSRAWRRASDVTVLLLPLTMAIAGSAGVPEILLGVSSGVAMGALLLVVFGAPNRRPTPAAIVSALRAAGLDVANLTLQRAVGGRAQLYRATATDGDSTFIKVYGRDTRDADLLYRGYRTLLLRGPNDDWPSLSLEHDVEHEALLLLLARAGGVNSPAMKVLTTLPDSSMALAMQDVGGRRLDTLAAEEIDAHLLDAVWQEVALLHRARLAHRSLRAANILVSDARPVIIDMGFGEESTSPRLQAIDRAELLASLTTIVGADEVIASAMRQLKADDLVAAVPFLQPLALSAGTRRQISKSLLRDLRAGIAQATGEEPAPLERLVRVRPRTVFTIVALTGAFYILLPQLANVGDSFRALRHANWVWLIACFAMSALTYVASAIGMAGGVPDHLPFVPNLETQLASSFVNRVTPANVGGMALGVRFMQKAGVDPTEAVTGMGLNVVAGAVVHIGLLFVFLAWAGQGNSSGFTIPHNSKVLVVVAVALAVLGIAAATHKGRRLMKTHVIRHVKTSISSIVRLSQSPAKIAALFGGSFGVTLAYIAALAAAVAAFHGGLSFAEVGAVYLGSSIIAAAAPTPGGLGAMEAALVAGFTGVGMDSGVAVAVVLSYRLATYWVPVLPGWIAFHMLERRNLI